MLRSSDSDLLEGGVEMPTEYLLSYALAPERTLRRPLTVGLVDEHEGIGKKGSEGDCGLNRESADNERISTSDSRSTRPIHAYTRGRFLCVLCFLRHFRIYNLLTTLEAERYSSNLPNRSLSSLHFFHPPFLLCSTTRRLTTRSQLARP
jgi:hypothetical protein